MEAINSEFDRENEFDDPSAIYPKKHATGLSPVEDIIQTQEELLS